MTARGDIRPAGPITLTAATSTGAGAWVSVGRIIPTRIGVEITGGKTGTVQLEGTIGSGSVLANVGAASTSSTAGRIVTLSTGLPAVSKIRAKVTAISASTTGTFTVKLAL